MANEYDPDRLYRIALAHRDDFIGLSVDEARRLASGLGLLLNVVEADGWHLGSQVNGRITVHVRDGAVVQVT